MKKFFKTFAICCLLIMSFIFTACDVDTTANSTNTNIDVNAGQNEIVDTTQTYTSISEATTALIDTISIDQRNTALPSEYQSNVYDISSTGNYYFTGNLTSAITVAKNAGSVHIYLDGVTLSIADNSAISAKSGSNVTITLIGMNNLTNTLGSNNKDKHIIDSKENLVINGNGTLTINSTKSAIACDKIFIGLGGTLNVTAVKHAITSDSIYINGLNINATYCGKDILHAESDYDEVTTAPEFDFGTGFVFIESGTINSTTVLGDGIQADSVVYIKGGVFNLTTSPTWENYTAVANQEKGMFNASSHQKIARDDVRAGQTYAILAESVKGIRVGEIDYYLSTDTNQENELTVASNDYTILIEGGTFNINTVDDAIHANSGSVFVYGGTFTISTSDDGIHADNNLKIAGDSNIIITNCYEGIEAETIDISGGTTTITALDDGVNATNSSLSENMQKQICQINISGGRLDVTVNPNGDRDGIDSNGGIKITGGVVITRGPNSQMASPIDAANAISLTGGIIIVVGNAPGSSGRFSGPGGRPGGQSEGSLTTTLTKTQSSTKGLSTGNHTVLMGNTTISYTNAYNYSGYTTVYASSIVTIN